MAPAGRVRQCKDTRPQTAPQLSPHCVSNQKTRRQFLRLLLQEEQLGVSKTTSGSPSSSRFCAGPCRRRVQTGELFSHLAIPTWVSWTWASLFSKLNVLRACVSGAGLKSWGCWMWGLNPSLLRKKLPFWVPLPPVSRPAGVGFLAGLCPGLSYLLSCGPSLRPPGLGVVKLLVFWFFFFIRSCSTRP